MHGIWTNLPEIWTTLNSKHDISDLGNVRVTETKVVLPRIKFGRGYAAVMMYGTGRKVHPWVLTKFIPRPSPMFTCCDHINRDRMDPRLVNLRWSNIVLNGMNKVGVRGYSLVSRSGVQMYQPNLKLLAMAFLFPVEDTPWRARAVYEYWQRRAYEVIDGLCSRNLHWKFQRIILEYWMPVGHMKTRTMKWQTDPVFATDPQNGQLI